MASSEALAFRRSRSPIRTFQALLFYIAGQWWDFAARLAGVISLNRKAFLVNFSDAADRQRSWEFWGLAWLLIALAERAAFGDGAVGDGLRIDAFAGDILQRLVLEALWMLPFYLILNLRTAAGLTFFEFWLNCGPVIATLLIVERVVELTFWFWLDPTLVSAHAELCPGATSVLPVLQTQCLAALAAIGVNTGVAQLAHVAVWSGLMLFGLLVLWRYTVVAQEEPLARAALRVVAVQVALWSVAFYFFTRGLA
ncbi:MAG: hypothetical protein AB7O98_13100 [Hyphomonadaceae bacterium]